MPITIAPGESIPGESRIVGRRPGRFRAVPLDGALLFFDPVSGTNIRWESTATRGCRRNAPRVVMFGITNHCNLACTFCSRDTKAESSWTVESAATLLEGLAAHGLLEVAFGGGEPLAFRGFDALLERLARTTRLALHLTTNGTLLGDAWLERLRPTLGEIRLSIYDDQPWPDRIRLLARSGVAFGANVLVARERIGALPALLHRLESLGCPDVALLRPIGDGTSGELGAEDEHRLTEVIAGTRLRVRLSACFADRLPHVPRLFAPTGADCGAGDEFVTLTPDRRLQACSFHHDGVPVETAADVLEALRARRDHYRRPSLRAGCGRGPAGSSLPRDSIEVWRAFSSNNSGDCVLVGRFEEVDDARRVLSELSPGFEPGEPFSDAWRETLADHGIATEPGDHAPDTLALVGRTLVAHTASAPEDDFPPLREFVWRNGGRTVYDGIHEHDPLVLLAGLGFPDAASLGAAEVELGVQDVGAFLRRGLDLYGMISIDGGMPRGLEHCIRDLEGIATRHGGVLAGELAPATEPPRLVELLATRPSRAQSEWLFLRCRDAETAGTLGGNLGDGTVAMDRFVLVRRDHVSPRLGAYALRLAEVATVVMGEQLAFDVTFYDRDHTSPVDAEALEHELRAELGPDGTARLEKQWAGATGVVSTAAPERVLPFLSHFAGARELAVWLEARSPRPLFEAMARVADDLVVLRRK